MLEPFFTICATFPVDKYPRVEGISCFMLYNSGDLSHDKQEENTVTFSP